MSSCPHMVLDAFGDAKDDFLSKEIFENVEVCIIIQ